MKLWLATRNEYIGQVLICIFLLGGCAGSASCQSSISTKQNIRKANPQFKSLAKAEKIALNMFRKFTHNKAKNISSELIEETDKEWVFVFEDADVIPRPGSEVYVIVEKASGKATPFYGM